MDTNLAKAFRKAVKAIGLIETREQALVSLAGETDEEARRRFEGRSGRGGVAAALCALHELDKLMPFERDPEHDVWETLVLETMDGNAWISVVNAIGTRERVTTWSTHPEYARVVEDWAACRVQSFQGDTEWDLARLERRVADYGGEQTLIDRGANLMLDRIMEAGCVTHYSCEGHPNGAYVGFSGDNAAAVAAAFETIGWSVEGGSPTVARMPRVKDVAERDAMWRKFSSEFHPVEPFERRPRRN